MELSLVLLIQSILSFATAAVYLYVGKIVVERRPSGDAGLAKRLFGVWWYGLGFVSLATGALQLPMAFGYADLAFAITIYNLILVLIAVAIWGLMYYLIYLYTGDRRWFWPITAAYGLLAVGLLYYMAWVQPIGLEQSALAVQLINTRDPPPSLRIGLGLGISVPVVIAAALYGTLFFRLTGTAQRYRVAMISGAFLFWFGYSMLATLLNLNERFGDSIAFVALGRVVGLLVPIVVLLAFRPPSWIRKRLVEAPGPTAEAAAEGNHL